MDAGRIIRRYLDAFDRGDWDAMLALLAPDVAHHVNQGGVEHGRDAFAAFLAHMDRCYRERLSDVVILTAPDVPGRAAAEFKVHGTYRATDAGAGGTLPEARGQPYVLPAGAFYDVAPGGLIARVAVHYDLADWIRQVS